jgi:EF-P beta-lysylation protein EpmB
MATILASNSNCVEATSPVEVRWQQAMRLAIRSSRELLECLKLPYNTIPNAAEADFPVFVPREYVARMRPQDPGDPLLLQVLATAAENATSGTASGLIDPVGDHLAKRAPGLLQKYTGRALLITTGACAVHCRYCFRRHYPYQTAPKGPSGWQASLDVIHSDPSIEEVILSGGDPLTVADSQLTWLIERLNQIAHVQRVRVHTRVPVVIPQRIDDELLTWVSSSRAAIYFVLHFNHPQEIDGDVRHAITRLRQSGASLLNQAVLLHAINDQPETQLELCRRLVNMQVIPYYLHQLDRVSGAMHFESTLEQGLKIIDHLRSNLPGYAVPKFVREEAGRPSKTPL